MPRKKPPAKMTLEQLGYTGPPVAHDRPLSELRSSGLLWLINRVVFHPRGMALALHETEDGEITGWRLVTPDGDEPFTFPDETDTEGFRRAEETLRAAMSQEEN